MPQQAKNCFIKPDETAVPAMERRLAEGRYDYVVIGAGVRLPPSRLVLFEVLVNAIHRAAPSTHQPFQLATPLPELTQLPEVAYPQGAEALSPAIEALLADAQLAQISPTGVLASAWRSAIAIC